MGSSVWDIDLFKVDRSAGGVNSSSLSRRCVALQAYAMGISGVFLRFLRYRYLGHGNGSRFLMSTFSEGLVARAVALIVGCSSGRPRLDGRHEPYASVFNHLIAGSPTVLSLLWDVTDRDIDRFTKAFLTGWLIEGEQRQQQRHPNSEGQKNLGFHIFKAVTACKLQSLVGKSVVVYGLPAEPVKKLPTSSFV
ncbi:hypothetical protein AAHC03_012876 [Spirometra sp. Aus1]